MWQLSRFVLMADMLYVMSVYTDPVSTTHWYAYNICTTSAQRLRRWANIVQMLYKCFVFTGRSPRKTDLQQSQANMYICHMCTAKNGYLFNCDLLLGPCRRRWANIIICPAGREVVQLFEFTGFQGCIYLQHNQIISKR